MSDTVRIQPTTKPSAKDTVRLPRPTKPAKSDTVRLPRPASSNAPTAPGNATLEDFLQQQKPHVEPPPQ